MLEIFRGDKRTIDLTVYTDKTMTVKQSLAGVVEITMTARACRASGPVVFTKKKSLSEVTVVDEDNGAVQVQLLPTDTTGLPPIRTKLVYDVEIEWPSSTPITVDSGEIMVQPDVTY